MYWSFQVIITRPIKKLTEDTLKKIDSLDLNFQTLPEGENEIEKAFSKINMLIDKLHLSNQNMEQFCYSLSHDLKSPLVTILSFLELLELDLKEKRDMSAQNYLVPMRSAGDTMLKLLHETLELLRYGQVPMKIETLELRDIVLQALTLVEGSLMGSHIRVSVSDTLPTVQGDRTRLIKVFQNLLDNAIKFSPDHEDSLIEVGQISMKGIPVIYVRDQGKGIEAAYHEMIFGIFNVLDPTPDSTGIGLSIVKQIIDDHQWRIWADSEGLGKGTTFYIALGKEQTVLKKDYKK
jgi:signal transduction histidine kinase